MIRNGFFVAFMAALLVWSLWDMTWEPARFWRIGIAIACWITLLGIYHFRHRPR
jgi:hypothetical protein